jgi:SPP1 family predicted phage head-tail adaptor
MNLASQQDAFGGPITADATVFAMVRASIEALTGRELYQAQQKVSEVTHKVTMRWMSGVKPNMNVWFSEGTPTVTRVFQILDVQNPDEKHHVLWLMCLERDASAYELPEGLPLPGPIAPVYYGKLTLVGATDGVNMVFTLPFIPPLPAQLLVFMNGLEANLDGDYQLSGATLTTNWPPSQLNVYYL